MKSIEPDHKCQARFSAESEAEFPIRWIRADSLDQARLLRRSAKRLWLGICGFSHRIFRAAYYGPLDLIVFNDLIISAGRCEEESRCLARQCPLNRTKESTLKKLVRTRRGKRINLEGLTETRHCSVFADNSSQGGIILPPS
ncbi:MAG: hypothetical protein ACREBU_08865 [Nitrososphaera sp.]